MLHRFLAGVLALVLADWLDVQDHLLAAELPIKLSALELVSQERIDALPGTERAAWRTCVERSNERSRREREILSNELTAIGAAASKPAPGNSAEFEVAAHLESRAWLETPDARALADVVLSYQTPSGGWSKAVDYAKGMRQPGVHWTSQSGSGWHYCGTLDNRSTTEQIRFLAEMFVATSDDRYQDGAVRGIQWLLDAQFPNGGWPQVYPLEPGYHEAITLNDGAMTHAIELLTEVAADAPPYAFASPDLKQQARTSVDAGIACLLRCQVEIGGRKTVWCAQHDPLTLAPVAARAKEPPSLSGSESADLVKFLMRSADDSAALRQSIEAAVVWFNAHQIKGLRKSKNAAGKTDYVSDTASEEVCWARFYDLTTELPVFAGAQDGIIYSSFTEMASKNKVAYDYFSTRPRHVITKEYARWKKRVKNE